MARETISARLRGKLVPAQYLPAHQLLLDLWPKEKDQKGQDMPFDPLKLEGRRAPIAELFVGRGLDPDAHSVFRKYAPGQSRSDVSRNGCITLSNGAGTHQNSDLNSSLVGTLSSSYIQHMHTLHPFLNLGKFRAMTERFIQEFTNNASTRSPIIIQRSISNAIVLLVLAIGEVCAQRGNPHDSPSVDTPGVAYFVCARKILGHQHGGHTVEHAQAMILASLYLNLFARVMEGWDYINNACRIIYLIIKTYLSHE
jgi:hypothetical protein